MNYSASTKKILVVTPRFPYPVIGGDKLRIYQLCKALSSRFELTLISLCESQIELNEPVSDDVFSSVYRVYHPKWRSLLSSFLALFGSGPLQVAYYRSQSFKARVRELLPQHDATLCHLVRTAEYVESFQGVKILEMTDAISLNYSRISSSKQKRGLKQFVFSLESKRLLAYERKIPNHFDLSVLVSPTDRDFLFPSVREDVHVCSNGVDLSGFPYQRRSGGGNAIAFIGNMRTVQNIDACRFFATEVLPILRQRNDLVFRIIGTIPEKVKIEFGRIEGVEVTGAVESIADAALGCFVGVCPMRLGAGVQNKVLEYMSLGLPAITSSLGYEGFSAKIGEDLLVADTVADWVDSILLVWNDPTKADAIGLSGRNYVETHHSWDSKLRPLVDRIDLLMSQ